MTDPAQPTDQLAALIHPSGVIEFIPFGIDLDSQAQLKLMYDRLGCDMVQAVTLDPITAVRPDLEFMTMWMDEEGKLNAKSSNPLATWLCQNAYQAIDPSDWISGPVLLTGGMDEEGETLPLEPESVKWLRDSGITGTETRTTLTITIDLENDAFQGEDGYSEITWILIGYANRIGDINDLDATLLDSNGNSVGGAKVTEEVV